MHKPVLLKEVVANIRIPAGGVLLDGTLGGGGHSEAIANNAGWKITIVGIDQDSIALKKVENLLGPIAGKLILQKGNFRNLDKVLKDNGIGEVDGIILDLGFSSEQLSSGKGFSFMKDEPLDMRYGDGEMTAAEVINSFNEKDLADIFWKYGEERFSRQIAKKIVEERRKKRILTTFELVEIIKKAVPKFYEKGRIHPATRVFQALRIYVNRELENLETLLKNLDKIIKNKPPHQTKLWCGGKGRVAIISFHSLEDRLVKNYFRQMAKEGLAEILTKKPITPSEEEIKNNPRSRSAKMRAIELK